ncbi:MAG TPA: TonB-dependent receptor plug domain-containing protein, partial [Polyangiaceae bacterium]
MVVASSRLGSLRLGASWALALTAPAAFAEPSERAGAATDVNAAAGKPAGSESAIVPPRLIGDAIALYPEDASGDATVVLVVTVGADGTVESAIATEAQPPFSEAAELAARSFRFTPATRAGRAVAAKIRLELHFQDPAPARESEPASAEQPGSAPASGDPVSNPASTEAPAENAAPTEVVVRGRRAEPSRNATLSRAEVREIPGTFGDPFRAIEVLPGVTPIVSGLPFFFIRGAPPGNVGYYLDGIRVPLLFHVGAGPSVVHPALIDRVDLYSGGYPAKFGRHAGGIVSGEALPPATELHGEYNLRLFDVGGLAELPFAEGRGSVLLGGRYSYTGLV